ncbi:MAG: GNAT family N-acetyltransferase [Rhodothermales bacterium]
MTDIVAVGASHVVSMLALAQESRLFDADGMIQIKESLNAYIEGNEELWFMAWDEKPLGVLYCIPEMMTEGTWNILMLIVIEDAQGKGCGRSLMHHAETVLKEQDVRLLIVETSSLDGFEVARAFYPKCGYTEEARIRNFYTKGDDKIIFTKSIDG